MNARERFKVGDRVRLTDACVERLARSPVYRGIAARRVGTLTGYGRHPAYVRLRRDGERREDRLGWKVDDLEPLAEAPQTV